MQNLNRIITILILGAIFLGTIYNVCAEELQRFSSSKLIANSANDGDSFFVNSGGKTLHIRLYFVDCPETSTSSKSDAQRVREQTRYFGLTNVRRTIYFGNKANKFVKNIIGEKTFTVHTAFASALGRSAKGRVYGFITTADGKDLASLLVENGLARVHGIGRKTPTGVSRDEMVKRLSDIETSAMLKLTGIWMESDPDKIAKFRAEQRREDQELKEIQKQIKDDPSSDILIDINTASENELKSIKGIGQVLAKRIIAGRPYKKVDDLLKVKGIAKKKLKNIRSKIIIKVATNGNQHIRP